MIFTGRLIPAIQIVPVIPPDTSLTGSPVIDYDDICTIPAASYKDQVFDNPTSGCVYIRRKWKVIDWAQYVPNTSIGVWEHIQDIHLVNHVKPVFTSSCADRTVCAVNAECDAVVKLGAHATDDCTKAVDLVYDYKIDVGNNGSQEYAATDDSFAIRMPRGIHKISWRVEDRCGNFTDCSFWLPSKNVRHRPRLFVWTINQPGRQWYGWHCNCLGKGF